MIHHLIGTEAILLMTFLNNQEKGRIEVSPTIATELNERRGFFGVEILYASAFMWNSILESMQQIMRCLFNVKCSLADRTRCY